MAPALPRRLLPWLRTPPSSSSAAAFSSAPSAGCARLAAACLAHAQAFKCGALAHPVVTNSLLKLYCSLGLLDRARRVLYSGGAALDVVSWNTMVSGYGKGGDLGAAREVFAGMPERNLVSWSAMVDACVRAGEFGEALWVFDRMMREEFRPDVVVLVSVLKACAHLGAVERGRWVHRYLETGSFGGRVDEGKRVFKSMQDYGIKPQREHYGCLADLLGRAGNVEEAEALLLDMPMEPHASQWGALMSSCQMHNDINVGERVGKRLIELEPYDGGRYVVLFNLYAVNGRWEEARTIRQMMEDRGAKKETGLSFIEWNGLVHEFISGDTRHPLTRKIYALLEDIERRLQLIGYVKDTSQVIMDMDDEEDKGIALSYHSERLALAFGILNIPQGVPIRIVKNLRVCRDCHVHSKLVSKLYEREIITMELARFRCQGNGGKADDGIQEMEEELPEPLASTLKLSPLLCFPHSICDSFLFHLHPKNSHPLHLFITPTLSFFLMDYSGGGPAPAPATGRARVRGRWCYCRCFRRWGRCFCCCYCCNSFPPTQDDLRGPATAAT
uniref:DYW domain-containing protein n=1 Tax=Oryza barthii TaxID=65489 RepID=A0A0D3F6A1_9ORYZ